MNNAGTPTVFVIDDDGASRTAMAALTESMGLRVRVFSSAEEFLDAYHKSDHGCVVTDLRMLGMSGLELQEELVTLESTLPLILITAYADVPTAVCAMSKGAVTVLEKPCHDQQLWDAIRSAIARCAQNREQMLRRREIRSRMQNLTASERDVMILLLAGTPNKTIATRLDIGLRTVETKRSNIMTKLKAKSLAELVHLVVESDGDEYHC